MLRKLLKRIYGEQKGITGLETAIILIAFVVVAAVFAYTVLSAGLFSTQKSQEAVYSGLQRTQNTIELKSSVIAKQDPNTPTEVGQLTFTVAVAAGGEAIDFNNPTNSNGLATGNNYVTISYIDKYQRVDNLAWSSVALGASNGDAMLDPGEQFQITIGGATSANNLVAALASQALLRDTTFTIEIKTAHGAVASFQRTTPSLINTINDLH
jgi:flagellin FlaB